MQSLFYWFSNPSFRALAWSLLASLWQAALIFFIAFALIKLNKNAPARIKYNIAALGQVVIAFWFIQTFLHHLSIQTSLTQPLTGPETAILFYPGRLPLLSGLYNQEATNTAVELDRLIPFVLFLYIIGVLIMSFRILYAYGYTKVLRKNGLFDVPANYLVHLNKACRQLKLINNIRIYLSNRVEVPVMMGFFKPVILLPLSIITHLTTVQIEAIITHELAHIKRRDYLMNIVQSILEAIFFYNPFVWLLSKIMREEREKACDELVTRDISAITYATALLALEEINETKRLTLAANGHKSHRLLNRIKNFTMKQNQIMSIKQKALSLLLIVVGLGCIAWLSPQKSTENKKKQANNISKQLFFQPNSDPSQSFAAVSADSMQKEISTQKTLPCADSLTPQLQKQIDEISKSAQKIADRVQRDTSWKKTVRDLQINAQKIALKLEHDSAWTRAIRRLTGDAEKLSQKIQEDPALKRQLQELEKKAKELSADQQRPSPEMQKHLEALRENSLKIALQFKKDTAWKARLKTIQFKAIELAKQMKENPEMAKKIKAMAEKSKDIAFKVLNDPKFRLQLEQLRTELQNMKFMDQDPE